MGAILEFTKYKTEDALKTNPLNLPNDKYQFENDLQFL